MIPLLCKRWIERIVSEEERNQSQVLEMTNGTDIVEPFERLTVNIPFVFLVYKRFMELSKE